MSSTTLSPTYTSRTIQDIATFGTQQGLEIVVFVYGWTDGSGTPRYLQTLSLASFGSFTLVGEQSYGGIGYVQMWRATPGSYTGTGTLSMTWGGSGSGIGYVWTARNAAYKTAGVGVWSEQVSFSGTATFNKRGGAAIASIVKYTTALPTVTGIDSYYNLTFSPYFRGKLAKRSGYSNLSESYSFNWSSGYGYGCLSYIYFDPLFEENMPRIL